MQKCVGTVAKADDSVTPAHALFPAAVLAIQRPPVYFSPVLAMPWTR